MRKLLLLFAVLFVAYSCGDDDDYVPVVEKKDIEIVSPVVTGSVLVPGVIDRCYPILTATLKNNTNTEQLVHILFELTDFNNISTTTMMREDYIIPANSSIELVDKQMDLDVSCSLLNNQYTKKRIMLTRKEF